MEIKIEKERKWVMRDLPVLDYNKIIHIVQYYVGGWRFRSEKVLLGPIDEPVTYIKLRKEKIAPGVNNEVDIQYISEEEYLNSFNPETTKFISKKRYVYSDEKLTYEIDVFETIPLTMMEIENVEVGDVIDFPESILNDITEEVTGNPLFDNSYLATNPSQHFNG